MLSKIPLVQNDSGPQFLFFLSDLATGKPVDLSREGLEAEFHFVLVGTTTVKAIIPMIVGPDATNGEVMLDWRNNTINALDTIGHYVGEIQIKWPEGRFQTTGKKLKFTIRKELA